MKSTVKVSKSGHKACINCIDGTTISRNLIATGSDDKSIRIWDIRANKAIKCITQCFESSVEAVKFSVSDDNTIYAASDRILFSFDLRTNGIIVKSPIMMTDNAATDEINCIDVKPDGDFLAVADDAGIITIINTRQLTANQPKRLYGHTSLVNTVAFSPINTYGLMSGGFDYLLNSWDLNTSTSISNPAAAANLSKLGNQNNDSVSTRSINPPFIQGISYMCNGRTVAVALGDGSLKIVDADDPNNLLAIASDAHAGMVTALFCSGGDTLYTGGIDRTVKCWKLEDKVISTAQLEAGRPSLDVDKASDGDIHLSAKEKLEKIEKEKRKRINKKKKNRRLEGNDYPMTLHLQWDEDNNEKINAISGFRIINDDLQSNQIFVGDVSSDLSIYNLE